MTSWSGFGGISFDFQGRKQEGKKAMWWGKCRVGKYCLEVLASRQRTRHSPRDFHISLNGGVGWGGIKSLSSLVTVSSGASAYPAEMSGGGEYTGIAAPTHPRGLAWRCLYPLPTPHPTPKPGAVLAIEGRKHSTHQGHPEVEGDEERKECQARVTSQPLPKSSLGSRIESL